MRDADFLTRNERLAANVRVAFVVLASASTSAHAVGLGNIRVESALGQPLRASIALIGADGADLSPTCLRARLETTDGVFMNAPSVAVLRGAGGNNAVLLSTRQSVNEPALSISLDLTCGATVHREFQILLDPVGNLPLLADAPSQPREALPLAPVSPSERSRRVRPRATGSSISRAASRPAQAPAGTTSQPGLLAANSLQPRPRVAPASPPVIPKNVLKLSNEPFTADELRSLGHLKLSGALTEPTLVTVARNTEQRAELDAARSQFAMVLRGEDPVQAAQRAQQVSQQQIAQLRQQAVTLAQQQVADRAALETLRQRSMPFSWLLGMGALLLCALIATGWLVWRLMAERKSRSNAPWEEALAPVNEPQAHDDAALVTRTSVAPRTFREPLRATGGLFGSGKKDSVDLASVPEFLRTAQANDDDRTERLPSLAKANRTAKPVDTAAGPTDVAAATAAAAAAAAAAADTREAMQSYSAKVENLKVEEISDVMQEAEFWMSLNDPQRAIEILEPYGSIERPESPIPWLFLLDLYRGTGAKERYDALHERAQRLFNARIPSWDEDGDITDGRTLEDYPHVVELTCEYWKTDHILIYLESLIFDNREGNRQGFDLAVYQDIMLLIAMVRSMGSTRPEGFGGVRHHQLSLE